MSEADVPPLDPEMRALLKRAAGVDAAPAEARMRVLERVESCIAPVGGGAGGGGSGTAGAGAGPDAGAAETASVTSAVGAPLGLAHRLVPLAVSFVLGGGVGGLVVSRTMRPAAPAAERQVIYIDRPAAVAAPNPPPATAAPTHPPGEPAAVTPDRPRQAAARNRLKTERRLLDLARGALERGEPGRALDATTRHERAYPGGVLVQEREAMAIRALVMLGRLGEARQRAAGFRARFPDSALWPAIESTIGSSPAQ